MAVEKKTLDGRDSIPCGGVAMRFTGGGIVANNTNKKNKKQMWHQDEVQTVPPKSSQRSCNHAELPQHV